MTITNTLRARLTLWYVSALLVALSAFALLLYAWLGRTLYRHHDAELLATSARVAKLLADVRLDEASVAAALRSVDPPPRLLMIRSDGGELIYRSPLLHVAEPSIGHHEALVHAAANAPGGPEFFNVVLERSGATRFVCLPIDRRPAAYVQIGNALGDVPATMHAVAISSVVLVPVVVLLTSVGGWLIAGRALAPIGSIDVTLRAIEATDLSRRVELYPSDRELSSLVETINGLLRRLQRAFQDLRDFTADASHQLRTPLTIMKSSIELARRRPDDPRAASLLDDLDQEVNDISAVVADLQALSLADVSVQDTASREVDLTSLCADATEILEALGELAGVSIEATIAPDVHVFGDATRLKHVILNLGDNAVKYTPHGGVVSIGLSREGGTAVLEVADTGIGIPEHERDRVFDRFFRASGAGSSTQGPGLGLAIVKRIIEVHRGTIAVSPGTSAGTRFTVRLPLASVGSEPHRARASA